MVYVGRSIYVHRCSAVPVTDWTGPRLFFGGEVYNLMPMNTFPIMFGRRSVKIKSGDLLSAVRLKLEIKKETEICLGIFADAFIIDWGDGESGTQFEHYYEQPGYYTLKMVGAAIHALDLSKIHLKEIVFENCIWLEHLRCSQNQLRELSLDQLPELVTLDCSGNHLEELNLEKNNCLHWLDCSRNALYSLKLSPVSQLAYLYCSCNHLKELNFSMCKKLYCLDIGYNELQAQELNICFAGLHQVRGALRAGIMLEGNPGDQKCKLDILHIRGWVIS